VSVLKPFYFILLYFIFTTFLCQRLNSSGSNMSGPATCPNMPNKDMSSGEGQRKIYKHPGHSLEKEEQAFQSTFGGTTG
jgi:hypothetical protein